MKRKLLCIAMVMIMAFGVFALSGCGGDDKAADSDKLIVGLDDTFAPMGFRDEKGNLVGFDIDLANAVRWRSCPCAPVSPQTQVSPWKRRGGPQAQCQQRL